MVSINQLRLLLAKDSHHPVLYINVYVQNINSNNFLLYTEEFFNFRKANFPELYNNLALVDWSSIYSGSVNEAVLEFYDKIYSVFKNHIHKKI